MVKDSRKPRIGVFLCECGGNISDVIDYNVIKPALETNSAAYVEVIQFLCAEHGMNAIKTAVKTKQLDRIVLGCCTPKMHRKKFEHTMDEANLNPAFLEIANLREHVSFVHPKAKETTQKALDLVQAAIGRVSTAVSLQASNYSPKPDILVIGGGIAGIIAALRVADLGKHVYLVEKSPSIGGHMIQYPKVFPTLDCSQCILTPRLTEVASNPNIKLFTGSELIELTGSGGDFQAVIRQKPRYIDSTLCISCGKCATVCPVEVPNEFNLGLDKRKAIYRPFPQAQPSTYLIDMDACVSCMNCVEACPAGAINHTQEPTQKTIPVGAVIVATGFELMDLENRFGEYYYRKHPNVITSLHMERLLDVTGPTNSRLFRFTDGAELKRATYVLCAGSRDNQRGVPYCSTVCCLYALKQATLLLKRGVEVFLHYIDIRSPGISYEDFYKHTQDFGARFFKGKVGEIIPNGASLRIRAEDMLLGEIIEYDTDMVVLCPPIAPSTDIDSLSKVLKIPLSEYKFILESHPKLDPLATKRDGLFVAGVASGPKDIQTSVAEAEGAALKAVSYTSQKKAISPEKAFLIDSDACQGNGVCVNICPVSAITLVNSRATINEHTCTGCGACIPACPSHALDLHGLTNQQLTNQIKGALSSASSSLRILVFAERDLVYTASDMIGGARINYPSSIRIVAIPSGARLRFEDILFAFQEGASGVMILEAPIGEGPMGNAHSIAEAHALEFQHELEARQIEASRLWFSHVFVPDWRKLASIFQSFDDLIRDMGPLSQSH